MVDRGFTLVEWKDPGGFGYRLRTLSLITNALGDCFNTKHSEYPSRIIRGWDKIVGDLPDLFPPPLRLKRAMVDRVQTGLAPEA